MKLNATLEIMLVTWPSFTLLFKLLVNQEIVKYLRGPNRLLSLLNLVPREEYVCDFLNRDLHPPLPINLLNLSRPYLLIRQREQDMD